MRDGSDTWRTLGNGNGAAGQNTAWSQKGHLGGGPRGRARAQPGLWEGESWAQPRRAQGRKRGAQFRQGFGVERGGRQPPTGHFHFCSWRASWRRWPCPLPASPPQELLLEGLMEVVALPVSLTSPGACALPARLPSPPQKLLPEGLVEEVALPTSLTSPGARWSHGSTAPPGSVPPACPGGPGAPPAGGFSKPAAPAGSQTAAPGALWPSPRMTPAAGAAPAREWGCSEPLRPSQASEHRSQPGPLLPEKGRSSDQSPTAGPDAWGSASWGQPPGVQPPGVSLLGATGRPVVALLSLAGFVPTCSRCRHF